MLVTPEEQIPIVEIEDSYSSSLMQDFLWFTKVHGPQFHLTVTYHCICTSDYNTPFYDSYPSTGVLSMGGNFVAAAVPRPFPDVVFMHSADSPQDAAGCLPSTGSLIVL